MKRQTVSQSKKLIQIGATALLFSTASQLAAPQSAHAQNPIRVSLNGQFVNFDQIAPVQVGGRVLVPLRGIFEALGATVNYDAATSTIFATQAGTNVQLQLGATQATVNGQTRLLDVPAQTRFGRTLVPLRFVSEALGANVSWNEMQRTVYIAPVGGDIDQGVPPVANNPYYPPSSVPSNRVVTLFGTVRRDLSGQQSFEMLSDSGAVVEVQTQAIEPPRLSRGDRVEVRGRLTGDVFVANTVRVIETTGRRARVVGTVTSVLSATRLIIRTDAGRNITVVSQAPFDANITVGDRVRVPGVQDGDYINAERVVLVTNRAGTPAAGQRVEFRGTVEYSDVIGQTLQVRGDNGVLYVIRYSNVRNFSEGDRVRVVGTYANGITTASSITAL